MTAMPLIELSWRLSSDGETYKPIFHYDLGQNIAVGYPDTVEIYNEIKIIEEGSENTKLISSMEELLAIHEELLEELLKEAVRIEDLPFEFPAYIWIMKVFAIKPFFRINMPHEIEEYEVIVHDEEMIHWSIYDLDKNLIETGDQTYVGEFYEVLEQIADDEWIIIDPRVSME